MYMCIHNHTYKQLIYQDINITVPFLNDVYISTTSPTLLAGSMEVNLADQTVYPESFRMHNDTLNMSLACGETSHPHMVRENNKAPIALVA